MCNIHIMYSFGEGGAQGSSSASKPVSPAMPAGPPREKVDYSTSRGWKTRWVESQAWQDSNGSWASSATPLYSAAWQNSVGCSRCIQNRGKEIQALRSILRSSLGWARAGRCAAGVSALAERTKEKVTDGAQGDAAEFC